MVFTLDSIQPNVVKFIKNNEKLVEKGMRPCVVNLEGPPGVGKSEILEQIAQELGYKYVLVSAAQISDVSDIIGFPQEVFEFVKDTHTLWIPKSIVSFYITQGYKPTGQCKLDYAPPLWMKQLQENTILNLDDFTRIDSAVKQAFMEFLLNGRTISFDLPKNCFIMLTSNPDNGDNQVEPMDTAQSERYLTIQVKQDTKVWANWASDKFDDLLVCFPLFYPEILDDNEKYKISARTMTKFLANIQFENCEKLDSDTVNFIYLCAGPDAKLADLFLAYLRDSKKRIISPETFFEMSQEKAFEVVADYTSRIAKNEQVASVFVSRLCSYCVNLVTSNTVTKKHVERMISLLREASTKEGLLAREYIPFILTRITNVKNVSKNLFLNEMMKSENQYITMKLFKND